MKDPKILYGICACLIMVILLSMVVGCPMKYELEEFKEMKKSMKKEEDLNEKEKKVVAMFEEGKSDAEISEYMNENIETFKDKESFGKMMRALDKIKKI